jgi:hypothetical protein
VECRYKRQCELLGNRNLVLSNMGTSYKGAPSSEFTFEVSGSDTKTLGNVLSVKARKKLEVKCEYKG